MPDLTVFKIAKAGSRGKPDGSAQRVCGGQWMRNRFDQPVEQGHARLHAAVGVAIPLVMIGAGVTNIIWLQSQ